MLFREEVIDFRSERLSGDVSIAVPIAWQSIGYLIFGGAVAMALFLCVASYARVETVSGAIVPEAGVARILPPRAGIVHALSVREGQLVTADEELLQIRSEMNDGSGNSVAAQVAAAIARQDASLEAQVAAARTAASAQLSQLAAQRGGLAAELSEISAQLTLQRSLVASAERDLVRAQSVADRGFISPRDLQTREDNLLLRRQGMSQLVQSLAAKQSALAEVDRNAQQLEAQARAQSASLAASRAQVAREAATNSGTRASVLRAPISGEVTALSARVGQAVEPNAPLMFIVPVGSTLRAELAVPSVAIGFVEVGQTVRLAIDAFPYQRFGTIEGRVLTVAASAIPAQGPGGTAIAIYPVTVQLSRDSVIAFGKMEPLVSGMTLTARIITDNRTLVEWLFEPLFAVRQR